MSEQLDGVALVGMAGRFPDANSVEELWALLVAGYDGISRFTPEQLSPTIPESLRHHPSYIAARGVVADADRFDAAFFGIPPREALLMDPQQRMLLELSWNALEHANVDPQRYPGSIGVYAGISNNGYRKLLDTRPDLIQASGEFAAMLGNEKDYVATRIAHRLGLNGPALSIHTACSTSLVAICQAWYALMSWQCDLALAGGINLVVPQESGYLPVDGGMESGDGTCRPYDAAANGTVFSSGGGMVAMKRLADAQADGDTIFAVLRGVGVNNDGADKASFTAPSVRGQASVVRLALGSAGVGAETIGYVEGHGTGTALGDPIEVEALTRAFREDTDDSQYCWLGSLKGNFGHLVAGSGVTGLIKAALALHYERIPPTLHYSQPNPEIDFAKTPFKVSARAIDWPRNGKPRRAGVSSFGVGGTNAHVVLEEAPPALTGEGGRVVSSLLLSARDEASLQRRVAELASALEEYDDSDLPDLAHTLSEGRRPFEFRCQITAATIADARTALARMQRVAVQGAVSKRPSLVFVFSGQGSQHANMARGLVASEPAFREALDQACQVAAPLLGRSLLALIHPSVGREDEADALLAQTGYTQPALFVIEYALARWYQSIGIEPDQMIGHSIGEYVAACLAGVFSLHDAIALVSARAAAMQAQPEGAMLAVRGSVQSIQDGLPADVEIAAINAPELTVVAGSALAIQNYAENLERAEIVNSPLRVSHAFHSASMDGAVERFRRAFDGISLNAPTKPFYSCVTGALISDDDATSVDYWCRQLRQPVRFLDAVRAAADDDAVFVEVGPSQALTGLIRRTDGLRHRAIASLGPAGPRNDDAWHLINAVGELACRGVIADSAKFYAGRRRRLLPLPTYPFHGERYWIDAPAATALAPTVPAAAAGSIMSTPFPTSLSSSPTPVSASPANAPARRTRLAAELTELFENLSGEVIGADHQATGFLEIGLDSLALTQAALELERRYGVKLKFRRLMEDLDSVHALSEMLDRELPPEAVVAVAPAPVASILPPNLSIATPTALAELIQSQLALLQQQSALLSSLAGTSLPATTPPVAMAAPVNDTLQRADLRAQPFGASARISTERKSVPTPEQRRWIDRFIAAYNDQTSRSKAFSQTHRQRMADPRVVTGFNPLWKELVYPIVVERSQGARLWDIDGNEYIDLLNSFGANFLGYQPDHIVHALKEQIDQGMEIGPQHPLTAEVADLISEMTGMQRVAFCNTGSEAVMGAMRVARTVTGRNTIVIFTNSYHGIFDEVIVRGTKRLRSIAAAPGILASAVENVLVLDYGSDEALAIIRERGAELAAVMIEPVQGKNPTLQPREFIHALRGICDDAGCALIFDEVITGFRVAQGGAQEFYGVRADIATYGKVIGGGLPLAVIAGSAQWLDALDGGDWQFGDDSYPEAGVTYFAGTFVRHPLALAAARAALLHIKREGPRLQREVSARTSRVIDQLNANFRELRAPLKAVGFSSLWRILVDENQPYAGLFWYSLRQRGLHVYEQFNCFLTEAHGEFEVDEIIDRITSAARDLLDAKLLTHVGMGIDAIVEKPINAVARNETPSSCSFPLSDAQRDKWLACQYGDEASCAFNESMLLHLEGSLDIAALKRSLESVFNRHDALRLRFASDGSSQEMDSNATLELVQLDLSGNDADERVAVHCHSEMSRPFNLEQAPLTRAHLLKLAPDRHAFLFIGHHLVFDGWSAAVLIDELARSYNADVAGTRVDLPPPESYRAYVESERQRRSGEYGNAAIAYWQEQFATLPALLALPSDRPRSRQPEFAGATLAHDFSATLTAALRAQARRRGVTLYSVLLHAFARLLAELSNQPDLVIGIPFAGQAIAGSGSLVGDGADMLPLRLDLSRDPAAPEALLATHGRLLDAADHQDLSINTLVRSGVLPKFGPSLARVVFNLNPRVPALQFAGLRHELRDCSKTSIFWDMFVNLSEVDDRLSLDLHYASSLFNPATVAAFVGRYQSLLTEMAEGGTDFAGLPTVKPMAAPHSATTDTRLARSASAHALGADTADSNAVIDAIIAAATNTPARMDTSNVAASLTNAESAVLNGPQSDIDPAASVPALIAAQAEATPMRIAVESGARRLTYAGLVQRVDALAAQLVEQGITRGELVGVCLPRGVELPIAVLGVQSAGAAYVALDASHPTERLLDIAEQSKLRSIVTLDDNDVPAELAKGRRVIAINTLDLRAAPVSALPTLHGDDLAYVLFTSGSTGRPKGVRILQRNLVNFLASMLQVPGFSSEDALLAVTTLSFDIAGLELFLPLVCGARMVIADNEETTDPLALAAVIRDCDVTTLQTTPTMLRMLLDGAGDDAVTGLKLLVGGETLPRDLADRALAHASELWNMYGPTETTIWSTVQRVHADDTEIALGQPIANTSIRLLDESGNVVTQGERGEIVIGGAGVADGYLDRAELSAERFVTDDDYGMPVHLYRSGDIGSIRDGRLYYHGRGDTQIKLRGHRIELGEIEAIAMQLPALREAAAKVHEAAPGDQRLLLYVSSRASGADPTDALRAHLLERLPGYMLPQQFIVLDALPKTPNGKLDRYALPPPETKALAASKVDSMATVDADRDPRTAWLADIWCDMIGLEHVNDEDNFFEIGGHSLLAVEMASQVQKETGVRVNLLMIATGTLTSLAAKLPPIADVAPVKPTAVSKVLGLFGIGKTSA